ncbi:MAG: 3-methyladenine DNA glycosylase [Sporichthyaceae bacterium]
MAAHSQRAARWTVPHCERGRRGEKHPVLDFLFTYYSHSPAALGRWHPGHGVALAGDPPHRGWKGYRRGPDGVEVDPGLLAGRHGCLARYVDGLLRATAARPPAFGCFGLHEWAMVYRSDEVRHPAYPLRLPPAQIADLVESSGVRCTHFDAFRFFTPAARPLNVIQPTRETAAELEQGGCLHANMDLYKWAYKLSPFTPSELLLDCFELARDTRELDMRAAPYDLRSLGYSPIPIETEAGRAAYVANQRTIALRAAPLRQELITVVAGMLVHPSTAPADKLA